MTNENWTQGDDINERPMDAAGDISDEATNEVAAGPACPTCGFVGIYTDDTYATFRAGNAPVRVLTVKMRAEWCGRCEWVRLEEIPNKTGRL